MRSHLWADTAAAVFAYNTAAGVAGASDVTSAGKERAAAVLAESWVSLEGRLSLGRGLGAVISNCEGGQSREDEESELHCERERSSDLHSRKMRVYR